MSRGSLDYLTKGIHMGYTVDVGYKVTLSQDHVCPRKELTLLQITRINYVLRYVHSSDRTN